MSEEEVLCVELKVMRGGRGLRRAKRSDEVEGRTKD